MRSEKFKPIEARFSAFFSKAAEEINNEFENVLCGMDVHYPPNDSPRHGFFSITLDCVLHKADFDNSDNIGLQVSIDDHADRFNVNAEVAWGYPLAKTVFEVFPEDVPVSANNLVIIENNLPVLLSKLKDELRDNPSGKPPPI